MPDPTNPPTPEALAERLGRLRPADAALLARLVDLLAARPVEPEVVRARRFELVDDYGRVRAVVGNLAGAAEPGDYYPGLALRSPEGGDRVTLVVHDGGPVVGLTLEGNDALVLGVDDPASSKGTRPGPYVELIGRTGTWRATDRGVEEERPDGGEVN